MSDRLSGKTAIITGAASGIGRAIAERFAAEGARLVVADIDEAGLEAVATDIQSGGYEVVAQVTDVSSESSVRALVDLSLDRLGRLDILSHNAGVDQPVTAALELDEGQVTRTMNVNVMGTFWVDTYAARAMLGGGGGAIVNTVSDLGYVVVPGLAAYCASKGAALQLTRVFATEWAPSVRVNALCPTMIDTPMGRRSLDSRPDPEAYLAEISAQIPMQRIGRAEDLAGAAVFLASGESAYVTGVALPIDGGRTVQ